MFVTQTFQFYLIIRQQQERNLMEPSLIYNGYHLQRRKMYMENPRHNLHSTIDITWSESLDNKVKSNNNPYLSKIQKLKQFQQRKKQEIYNDFVQKQIQDKLKLDKSTFRVIPIQSKYDLQQHQYGYQSLVNNPEEKAVLSRQPLYNNSHTINYDENYNKKNSQYPQGQNQTLQMSRIQSQADYQNPNFGKSAQIRKDPNQNKQFNFQRQYKNIYSSARQIQGNHFPSVYAMPQSPNKYASLGKSSKNVSQSIFGYQLNNHIRTPYQGRDSYLSKMFVEDSLQPFLRPQNKSYKKHQSLSINHPVKLNY